MDQFLRGPGTRYERKNVYPPECLTEWYMCERLHFRLLPDGLAPGHMADQPVDRLYYWMQVAGIETGEREKCEARRARMK